MDLDTVAWLEASFMAGVASGVTLAYKLMHHTDGSKRATVTRTQAEFARRDIIPGVPLTDEFVRLETDYETQGVEQRLLSFTIFDNRVGLDRDVQYSAHVVMTFLKCDTPRRTEFRGDNNTYSQLCAIGTHYGWIRKVGPGYQWAIWFSTREKRLNALTAWVTH